LGIQTQKFCGLEVPTLILNLDLEEEQNNDCFSPIFMIMVRLNNFQSKKADYFICCSGER